MESKKNPKSDVSRNGSIYFAVGLALMFITPILSESYYFLNSTIETLLTKSVMIS